MRVGVDEAGKGPAIGSMFAAAVRVPDPAVLPEGIADSKRLSPAKRESLAETLRADDRVAIGVAEVPPARIDDPATDMNGLAVAAHAEAIDGLGAAPDGAAPDGIEATPGGTGADTDGVGADTEGDAEDPAVLCDACDTDADRFARRVAAACDLDATVEARHGADDESALVGAASVIAKVERDAHVAALAAEYDGYGELGSGYPGDPKTRQFLEAYVEANGTLPDCARESWSTCEDVLAAASQAGLDEF